MGVVIHEIENIPPASETARPLQATAPAQPQENGSPSTRQAKLMPLIRLEASRAARLWAD